MDREEILNEIIRIDFNARFDGYNEDALKRKAELLTLLAKETICSFFGDHVSQEAKEKAKGLLDEIPIELVHIEKSKNIYGKNLTPAAYMRGQVMYLDMNSIKSLESRDKHSVDEIVALIIHEYFHGLRKQGHKDNAGYFEEGFADLFAEMCINNERIKTNREDGLYITPSSLEYERAERQVRTIMFSLKEKGKDIEALSEFLLGEDSKFLEICTSIFGEKFDDYFNQVNNMDLNVNYSTDLLTEMVSKLIEDNEIDLRNIPIDLTQLSPNNLYFVNNYIFSKSVELIEEDKITEEQSTFIKDNEDGKRISEEYDQEKDTARDERIREYIKERFDLKDKTQEEVHDTVVDLASDYIQRKDSPYEEDIIFFKELEEQIPFLEDFVEIFKELRLERKDKQILDNMDLEDISYEKIYSKMQTMRPKEELDLEEQKREDLAEMLEDNVDVKSQDISKNR
jgi:hypothetical protein